MAPRKDKVEKASGDAAVDLILNYLRKQKYVQNHYYGHVPVDHLNDNELLIVVLTPQPTSPPTSTIRSQKVNSPFPSRV